MSCTVFPVEKKSYSAMLDAMSRNIYFHEEWVSVQSRFSKLCEFSGGLATVYPGKTRVEREFSIIGWEKEEYRTALMDLSLEGIMQAKQSSTCRKFESYIGYVALGSKWHKQKSGFSQNILFMYIMSYEIFVEAWIFVIIYLYHKVVMKLKK